MNEINSNDSAIDIITQAIDEMKKIHGNDFNTEKINLVELERLTGITRQRLKTFQSHGLKDVLLGLTGNTTGASVMDGYTGMVDNLMKRGVTNSTVVNEKLIGQSFPESIIIARMYAI